MRKSFISILLCLCMLFMTGCSEFREVENLAYVVLFGIDLLEDGQVEISVQIPKISGSSGQSESSSSEGSSDVLYSAKDAHFNRALQKLQWVVPRRMDMSQIKLVIVSETLARNPLFWEIANEMMGVYRIYTAARLVVCDGNVRSFIENEKLQIGARMATELTAMFEDYTYNAYVPDVHFADVYYNSASIYSDPLTVYAATASDAASEEPEEPSSSPSIIISTDPTTNSVDSPTPNRFLGAAVLHKGIMAGVLNGPQSLHCKLLRGMGQGFLVESDQKALYLETSGRPKITIDTDSEPVKIDIALTFSIESDAKNVNTDEMARALEQEFLNTIHFCKQLGVEPFRFAERAASHFMTIDDWLEYDWHAHFLDSEVSVKVDLQSADP